MSQPTVVMITGASAGVGRATALRFARLGVRVGLLARGRARLEATRRDVEAAGGHAIICQAWVKSRLPHRAQPVPPIFQPEVAAEAIVWATGHDRREVYVGLPTVRTAVGNALAPGLVDRVLARVGYTSQQTAEPEDPDRPSNLWEPVDRERDFGAHGRFDPVRGLEAGSSG